MKTVFLAALLFTCKLGLNCQPTIEDFVDYDYKVEGNVSSIYEESYLLNEDNTIARKKWDANWELDKKIQFNQSNKVTRIDYLDSSDNVSSSDLFKYENDKLLHRKLKYSNEIYFYENGLLVETYSEVSQPKIIKTGFEKPLPNSYESKIKYQYDNGKLINVKEFNSSNEIECQGTLKYDSTTDLLLVVENLCGEVNEKYEYKYSGDKLIQIKWSDNYDGLIEQSDYKYDNGKIIEESWKLYDEGEYSGKVVTKYQNFNMIEVTESNENDEIDFVIKYKYEFDENGNWIKKYIIGEDEKYLVTRQIQY